MKFAHVCMIGDAETRKQDVILQYLRLGNSGFKFILFEVKVNAGLCNNKKYQVPNTGANHRDLLLKALRDGKSVDLFFASICQLKQVRATW